MRVNLKKNITLIIIIVLTLSLFLTSMAFADGTFKNLKAWFGDIKIFVNNKQVQMDVQPFIVDGTTYVPVRALSNILNQEVAWDGTNRRIDITDKSNQYTSYISYLSQQLTEKQNKINELEAKVAELQAQLTTSKQGSKYTLSQMEKYLNDEYGVYKKITFDIELYGDKEDIEVEIYVDLDDYYSKWNSLTTSEIKSYIKDIVDDILDNFKDAKVSGFIEDSYNDKKLVEFYLNKKGSLTVNIKDSRYKYTYDIDDLEDYLNKNYDEYEGVYFTITLSGDKDNIRVYVTTDDNDLKKLYTSEIKEYLKDLYSEIIYDFPDAYVYGYIRDDYNRYYFDFDTEGNIYLDK